MRSERRLHPASILFALGAQFRALVLPALFLLFTTRSSSVPWELFGLLFLVPTALFAASRYFTFRYRYEESELVIRSGLLFRNERHVPYARIQNLDAVENLLHRLFGVVEARVHTGGGKEPEAKLSVLPRADFEEMRRRVFAGQEEARGTEALASGAAPPTLLHLPPRELVLAGLINNRGGVLIAAGFGVLLELGLLEGPMDRLLGEEAAGKGVVRDIVRSVFADAALPLDRLGVALAALVGLLLLVRLFSMAWTTVRLWGYRVSRVGEDLRSEYGSLTRVAATIPLHRIQTVTVKETPLHRLFGRVSLKVDTAGADGGAESGQKQREWLAPLIRGAELPAFLATLLPGVDLDAVAWQPVHPKAFVREAKGGVIVAALLTLPLVAFFELWALAPFTLFVLWALLSARLTVKNMGWAATESDVLYKSGWIVRQLSLARFAKIQAVSLHESPFDRRRGMARLRVDTAGASDLAHRISVPYLAKATAQDLASRLVAEAEGRAFRW